MADERLPSAFSAARRFPIGIVAHVTNSASQTGKAFDKGAYELEFGILEAICCAGKRFVSSSNVKEK
ncbi:MAG: hypothetical protein ACYCPP_07605 [Nitrososphaerales archaeon]